MTKYANMRRKDEASGAQKRKKKIKEDEAGGIEKTESMQKKSEELIKAGKA